MLADNKISKACALAIKICVLGYAFILGLILMSNFSIVNPNWPFGLFASFSSSLIVISPLIVGLMFMAWRKAIPLVTMLALVAFYPFYSFDKMVKPTGETCVEVDCISVVAANLRHKETALKSLSETKAKDADILIFVEFPYKLTGEDLLALFPMDGEAQVGLMTDPNLRLASRIAVVSRKPLNQVKLQLESIPESNQPRRGIVKFEYATDLGNHINFVVVHPPPPKGPEKTAVRDAYLKAASQTLEKQANFVMIGDFNLTPWEPSFDELPGKRAGDPRWTRTWNARNFYERITIDHALIGDGIGLVETHIMQDVGSDHFPIHLVIHPKGQKSPVDLN